MQASTNQFNIKKLKSFLGGDSYQELIFNDINRLKSKGCNDEDLVLFNDAICSLAPNKITANDIA